MKQLTSITRLGWLLTVALLLFSQAAHAKGLSKQAKKQVEERYKKSKMAWGEDPLEDLRTFKELGTVLVAVKPFPSSEVDIRDGQMVKSGSYIHEVQPGTTLGISGLTIKDDRVSLTCITVEPVHQVRPFATTFDRTMTTLRFFFDKQTMEAADLDHIYSAIDSWVKPFDSHDEAIKFGNTVSGTFVKEIKLGMTFTEVESIFGIPEKKATLGNKVIYKYKDMAIEFVDGKVADVKF